MGAEGALGGPARPGVNLGGNPPNLGAAPHDWGFAKNVQNANNIELFTKFIYVIMIVYWYIYQNYVCYNDCLLGICLNILFFFPSCVPPFCCLGHKQDFHLPPDIVLLLPPICKDLQAKKKLGCTCNSSWQCLLGRSIILHTMVLLYRKRVLHATTVPVP